MKTLGDLYANCRTKLAKYQLVLWLALAVVPFSARAEYRLQVGDVVEFSVIGAPELGKRLAIGVDGVVSVPFAGPINVTGSSLSQVRDQIAHAFTNRVYTQRLEDGRETPRVISAGEIMISVAEYRPVYVRGDVAKSGEQTFRPGMTVRQAIALAGGFDVMRFRMNNPILESADLRAEYMGLWTEVAREEARIWRIRAELGETREKQPTLSAPLARDVLSELARNEVATLKARTQDLDKEKSYLNTAVKEAEAQLVALSDKRKAAEAGNQADVDDYDKVRELFNKGMTPTTRLSEARRAVLLSQIQVLQTITDTSQIERQRGTYNRQLDKTNDERRIQLLNQLQDANVKLNQIKSKVQITSEKLLYTSAMQSQLSQSKGVQPEMRIFRSGKNGREQLTADEDTELAPGDVINVVLQAETLVGMPMR